jgi:hypothetical protein
MLLLPIAFLFDLVPDLGRAVAQTWRKNVRDSRTVFRVVVQAWRGVAFI